VATFPLIGNWLIWRVGKGDKVQVGLDPQISSKRGTQAAKSSHSRSKIQ